MDAIWEELNFEIKTCKKCKLCENRKLAVLGNGNRKSPILFVGEAPNTDEDEQGKAFVGVMGDLLTKILTSVSINRDDVYLTNVIKCKGDKSPDDEDIETCYQYLETEIALLNPKIIVSLGLSPTRVLLKKLNDENLAMTKLRGKVFDWEGNIKLIPVFHPNYLLRNTSTSEGSPKWLTWQDMKMIKNMYDKMTGQDSF